jgi:hypothetical protein
MHFSTSYAKWGESIIRTLGSLHRYMPYQKRIISDPSENFVKETDLPPPAQRLKKKVKDGCELGRDELQMAGIENLPGKLLSPAL